VCGEEIGEYMRIKFCYLLFFINYLFGMTIFASTWVITNHSDSSEQVGMFAQETKDSNFLIATTYFKSPFTKCAPHLIKLNQQGKIVWDKIYSHNETTVSVTVHEISGSRYLTTGFTKLKEKNLGWLQIIDKDGKILLEKTYGSGAQQKIADIIETKNSNFIAIGEKWTIEKGQSIWLLKLNKYGDIIWEKTYGGRPDYVTGTSIVIDSNNQYIITGSTYELDPGISGFTWIFRLDQDGNTLWEKKYNPQYKEDMSRLLILGRNHYLLGSCTMANSLTPYSLRLTQFKNDKVLENNIYFTNIHHGAILLESLNKTSDDKAIIGGGKAYNSWIIKMDYHGNKLWEKTYFPEKEGCVNSIVETRDKGYIIVGYIKNNKKTKIFIIKTDKDGNY
jgi:hypothetical protein